MLSAELLTRTGDECGSREGMIWGLEVGCWGNEGREEARGKWRKVHIDRERDRLGDTKKFWEMLEFCD